MIKPIDVLRDLLDRAGRPMRPEDEVSITGEDPALPTRFLLGTAGATALAAVGLAAADLWKLRTGRGQSVRVDMRAAAASMRSERYLRLDGGAAPERWDPISGFYQCGDGRWVQLHCNFPHHRDGALRVLGCANDRKASEKAISSSTAQAIEDTFAEEGLCAAMVRSPEEWDAHPQGKAVAALPLMEVVRIGDAPPEPSGAGDRPLSGVRALDLTRVIAGPVAGRMLTLFGADVLHVCAPHLFFSDALVMDTGFGKRSAFLDLRSVGDRDRLTALARGADVFMQGYRPGTIADRGFSPEELAATRPGIVCVTVCAYGYAGPWQSRRGFDSLVQCANGIAHEGGENGKPRHMPAQAQDHITGYLAALGAMIALACRAREGGSWHVRVSLAQTGHWIKGLGRVTGVRDPRQIPEPSAEDIGDLLLQTDSSFGRITHVAPAIQLGETPAYWAQAPVPLGTHQADWPGASS